MLAIPYKSHLRAAFCLLPGIGLLLGGFDYGIGTLDRPEPGLFPAIIGAVLVMIGAGLGLSGRKESYRALKITLRPYIVYPVALLGFAFAAPRLGLLPAVAVATTLAALARPDTSLSETAILALAMAAITYVVFILVLGLPVPAIAWRP